MSSHFRGRLLSLWQTTTRSAAAGPVLSSQAARSTATSAIQDISCSLGSVRQPGRSGMPLRRLLGSSQPTAARSTSAGALQLPHSHRLSGTVPASAWQASAPSSTRPQPLASDRHAAVVPRATTPGGWPTGPSPASWARPIPPGAAPSPATPASRPPFGSAHSVPAQPQQPARDAASSGQLPGQASIQPTASFPHDQLVDGSTAASHTSSSSYSPSATGPWSPSPATAASTGSSSSSSPQAYPAPQQQHNQAYPQAAAAGGPSPASSPSGEAPGSAPGPSQGPSVTSAAVVTAPPRPGTFTPTRSYSQHIKSDKALLAALNQPPRTYAHGMQSVLDSIIKIYTVHSRPNYTLPWQNHPKRESTGTGFVVHDRLILTNAHVVADATYVLVKRHGSGTKYRAGRLASVRHGQGLYVRACVP